MARSNVSGSGGNAKRSSGSLYALFIVNLSCNCLGFRPRRALMDYQDTWKNITRVWCDGCVGLCSEIDC